MAQNLPNRFLAEAGSPRAVACLSYRHPSPERSASYAFVEDLAGRCGLDLRYVQTRAVDPRELDEPLLSLLDRELFVPASEPALVADRAHFEATVPERVAALEQAARDALGEHAEAVLTGRAWMVAFGVARAAQAWGAQVVLSGWVGDMTSSGFVVSQLLGIPWVAAATGEMTREPKAAWGATALLAAACADVLVPDPPRLADKICERHGEELRARVVAAGWTDEDLAPRIGALRAERPAAAIPTGPGAAFVTERSVEPDPGGPLPFVIIGAERTGSNMLVGMIKSRKDVIIGGELFNRRLMDAGELLWDTKTEARADELRALREQDPRGFLREVGREAADAGASAWGFKLLYYHGSTQNAVVDHLVALPRLRVIHLRRRGRLQRWLSHRRAELTDSWYSNKRQKVEGPITVELGVEPTLQDFLVNEWMEERYAALFAGCPVLELDYESFTTDIDGTAERLATFLDIPLSDLVVSSRKTGTKPLRESIADYDEVASGLASTRWSDQARVGS